MVINSETCENAQNPKNSPKNKSGLRWVFVGGALAWLTIGAIAIWHPGIIGRVKFFSDSTLNLFIVLAVIAQVLIYRKQWDSMRDQVRIMGVAFDPRLRITSVRVENLEAGKEPVFMVSIINEGATDARDVELNIRVNLAEEDALAVKWSSPQIVTIPAGQEQDYFVPWRSPLTQERIDTFNKSVKVSGYFKLADTKKQDFCYRYYPWKGERPKGVAQFIPCDFDPALTTVVKVRGIEVKTAVGTIGVVIEKSTPEDARPQEAAVADRKDDQQNPASDP